MTTFQALILGVFQGIAEFLPISSSGHLILLQAMFGIEEPALTFDIVVHIGSLIAIAVVFWQKIWTLISKPFCKMAALLIVGTLPAVVVGSLLRDVIESYFRTGIWLAAAFTVTGVMLLFADKFSNGEKAEKDITFLDAAIIGLCQAFALLPGISRSGSTIAGALSRGINRTAAAEFSFMLAIIAIAGAGVLELMQILTGDIPPSNIGFTQMAVGFVASLVASYFSIRLLLKLIKACKLRYFSVYLWVLAVLILVDVWIIGVVF